MNNSVNNKKAFNLFGKVLYLGIIYSVLLTLTSCPSPAQEEENTATVSPVIPEVVHIDGGDFTMGYASGDTDEASEHNVTISGFSMGKYEVTHGEFINFLNHKGVGSQGSLNGYELIDLNDYHCAVVYSGGEFQFSSDEYYPSSSCPVALVTWHGAVAYCEWLSDVTGAVYRLPTEAEWEYAARGGSANERNLYAGSADLDSVGWYSGNSSDKTHSVGGKGVNTVGLYDMSGNINEWCSDYYDSDYYNTSAATDPQGPSSGSQRILRGGGYNRDAGFCRVSFRDFRVPGGTELNYGFRVVRE